MLSVEVRMLHTVKQPGIDGFVFRIVGTVILVFKVKQEVCETCGGKNINNKTKLPEILVSCRDCGRSGHPTCFELSSNMVTSSKVFGWQCYECKSCTVCGKADNDDMLLFCDDCDQGFHCYCLTPTLDAPPKGDWSCKSCKTKFTQKLLCETDEAVNKAHDVMDAVLVSLIPNQLIQEINADDNDHKAKFD